MYHGGEDIAFADLSLHKGHRLGKVGLYLLSAPALEKLRAGGDKGIHKHSAVFPRLAARRLNPAADFLPIFLLWLNDVDVVFASCRVYIGIAGVLLFGALMVCFQVKFRCSYNCGFFKKNSEYSKMEKFGDYAGYV